MFLRHAAICAVVIAALASDRPSLWTNTPTPPPTKNVGAKEMPKFEVVLVPTSMVPLIRTMHRQTRQFEAADMKEAQKMVAGAFPGGIDGTGEWSVEEVRTAQGED